MIFKVLFLDSNRPSRSRAFDDINTQNEITAHAVALEQYRSILGDETAVWCERPGRSVQVVVMAESVQGDVERVLDPTGANNL